MSDEEIRLEAAKLAVQCFVNFNSNHTLRDFSANATFLYDYIKSGKLPRDNNEDSKSGK